MTTIHRKENRRVTAGSSFCWNSICLWERSFFFFFKKGAFSQTNTVSPLQLTHKIVPFSMLSVFSFQITPKPKPLDQTENRYVVWIDWLLFWNVKADLCMPCTVRFWRLANSYRVCDSRTTLIIARPVN